MEPITPSELFEREVLPSLMWRGGEYCPDNQKHLWGLTVSSIAEGQSFRLCSRCGERQERRTYELGAPLGQRPSTPTIEILTSPGLHSLEAMRRRMRIAKQTEP